MHPRESVMYPGSISPFGCGVQPGSMCCLMIAEQLRLFQIPSEAAALGEVAGHLCLVVVPLSESSDVIFIRSLM